MIVFNFTALLHFMFMLSVRVTLAVIWYLLSLKVVSILFSLVSGRKDFYYDLAQGPIFNIDLFTNNQRRLISLFKFIFSQSQSIFR